MIILNLGILIMMYLHWISKIKASKKKNIISHLLQEKRAVDKMEGVHRRDKPSPGNLKNEGRVIAECLSTSQSC